MRVLLHTQAFIWALLDAPKLSDTARATIENPDNELLVSPASLWEIAIKISMGKYSLQQDFAPFMERHLTESGIALLPIDVTHLGVVATLPFHDRDPFDRLVIAQGIAERLPIVSADAVFDRYGVNRLW